MDGIKSGIREGISDTQLKNLLNGNIKDLCYQGRQTIMCVAGRGELKRGEKGKMLTTPQGML